MKERFNLYRCPCGYMLVTVGELCWSCRREGNKVDRLKRAVVRGWLSLWNRKGSGILAGLVLLAACAFCDTVGAERHTGSRGKPHTVKVSWTALKVAAADTTEGK